MASQFEFPKLSTLYDVVEDGGRVRKTLETELRRGYFVTFCFQQLSGFCLTDLSVCLLSFIRTLVLA